MSAVSDTTERLTGMSTTEAISTYVAYTERFTPRTRELYRYVLHRFQDCCMPDRIADLRMEHIEKYLLRVGPSNRTKNAHLTVVKSFTRFVSDRYNLPNPGAKIKMFKEDPPKRRWLTEQEYEKILSACKPNQKRVIQLLATTGLRAGELRNLQLSNISADMKMLRFAGKGRKARAVPLCKTAQQCLQTDSRLNIDFLKSYRYRNGLNQLCRRLSRKSGVSLFGPHALRRLFATSLIQKGVSVYTVSKLLGHADVRTTEIYLNCSGEDLAGVTDVLD